MAWQGAGGQGRLVGRPPPVFQSAEQSRQLADLAPQQYYLGFALVKGSFQFFHLP